MDNTPASADVKRLWPLGIFLLLSAASAWTAWLWPIDSRERLLLSVFGMEFKIPLLAVKLVIGNCLPGILAVIWALFEGRDQFRRMLSTLTKWRTRLRWYIVAVALPCSVFVVALNVVLFYFATGYLLPSPVGVLTTFLMTLPFGPLWEELAWRAFALKRLEFRYSRLVSVLLLGVYWGVWHIPLWLVLQGSTPINKIAFLSTGIINTIAWSVIFAYLYHCSLESLPVVVVLHATHTAFQVQVLAVVPYLQGELLTYVSVVLSVCLAVPFARAMRRRGDTEVGE
ncbi:MAG: CPBP family intramembrane glutamic endopeptidase [Terriglobales bacterium]